jgi:hypothetical protein
MTHPEFGLQEGRIEDASEVAKAGGGVEAFGHRRRLQARRLAAARACVV